MEKIRIAFTGVFDLANYGDHLFPEVFETQMKKRGIDCEITLFSCFSCQQAFEETRHVYSVYEIEKLHKETPFAAIVAGGGEIIHLNLFRHMMNQKMVEYPIFALWVVPSLLARKYGVKLIWNLPGIPFDFSMSQRMYVKKWIEEVDYLGVRNVQSKESLKRIGVEEDQIHLASDTAFLLKDSFVPDRSLLERLGLEEGKRYVVVHVSKLCPESERGILIETLNKVKAQGYEIVFLPLAYTNEDEKTAEFFNAMLEQPGKTWEKRLSLEEIVSILAFGSLYVGFSFHGAITAVCYGRPVIAYDYAHNRKMKDLFDSLDCLDDYCVTAGQLSDRVDIFLSGQMEQRPDLEKIQTDVREHFDAVAKVLRETGSRLSKEISCQDIIAFLAEQSREQQIWSGEMGELRDGYHRECEMRKAAEEELQKLKEAHEFVCKEWTNTAKDLEGTLHQLNESNAAREKLELELKNMQESVSWKMTEPMRRVFDKHKNNK